MRVCYHVQSHTLPAQLVAAGPDIRDVQPDEPDRGQPRRDRPDLELGELAADPAVIVRRVPDGYGDFSHIDRWLEAVDLLADRGEDYGWLCNLSGQDYPLVPLARAQRELEDGGADAYLQRSRSSPAAGSGRAARA